MSEAEAEAAVVAGWMAEVHGERLRAVAAIVARRVHLLDQRRELRLYREWSRAGAR